MIDLFQEIPVLIKVTRGLPTFTDVAYSCGDLNVWTVIRDLGAIFVNADRRSAIGGSRRSACQRDPVRDFGGNDRDRLTGEVPRQIPPRGQSLFTQHK